MSTYAISDLHGQYDIFEKLLDVIDFSENDFLYVLGDAIDRGPDGIKILQKIKDTPNMDLLIGNHEYMMLNSIDLDGYSEDLPGDSAELWMYYNGGDETFDQYCSLSESERKNLVEWLLTRKLTTLIDMDGRTICLTHSYFNEECIDKEYKDCNNRVIWNVVWKTPYRYDLEVPIDHYSEKDWDFMIGHVPVQRVAGLDVKLQAFHEQNVLLIDGGCSYGPRNVLDPNEYGVICIRLEDMNETVVTFASL